MEFNGVRATFSNMILYDGRYAFYFKQIQSKNLFVKYCEFYT